MHGLFYVKIISGTQVVSILWAERTTRAFGGDCWPGQENYAVRVPKVCYEATGHAQLMILNGPLELVFIELGIGDSTLVGFAVKEAHGPVRPNKCEIQLSFDDLNPAFKDKPAGEPVFDNKKAI